jgi:predicted DNA-binding mobile mystery protein A
LINYGYSHNIARRIRAIAMDKSKQIALARLRIDERLSPFREQELRQQPPNLGWLRTIRKALGMTRKQFGQLLGVTQATVADIETSERDGRIQLNTLRRAAAALDCEFVYALVPRVPLTQRVEARLDALADAAYQRTAHSMALEGQLEEDPAAKAIKIRAIRDAIALRDLWRE